MSFFVHNRAWLTAAACESALTGSMEGVTEKTDSHRRSSIVSGSRELGNVGFFGAENLTGQVNGGKEINSKLIQRIQCLDLEDLKWKLASGWKFQSRSIR